MQSLKSLASTLHLQLPLGSKESHRLLTALTSSFRKHLDEVHPPAAGENGKLRSGIRNEGISKTSSHALHSSATFADKHLASVLTNPLMTKGTGAAKKADQDFAIAQMELQKNPARDPISLLEEYHERGAATVPIARLCLEVFQQSLSGLSEAAQQKAITECEAGRRALSWLWRSEQYKKPAFVDDRTFIDLLVLALLQEDREKILWEWIQLDQVLGDEENLYKGVQRDYHRYRWKGRLLRRMVDIRLGSPHRERRDAGAALDVWFKACDMKVSASKDSHMRLLPLGQAGSRLSRAFTSRDQDYRNTDPQRYDQFIETTPHFTNEVYGALRVGNFHLRHPNGPNAQPALHFWQRVFNDTSPLWQRFSAPLKQPLVERRELAWYSMMVETAGCLLQEGRAKDAAWMEARTREMFPETSRKYYEIELRKYHQEDRRKPISEENEGSKPVIERIPFPTFG